MLSLEPSRLALDRLFAHQRIADLPKLQGLLQTSSRMSVFRRLAALGYYSSYSHNGRYYTLQNIPRFDADGLWQHQGVCFSYHGSLKFTVAHLVDVAEAGRTHHELRVLLHVRVHNTLLDLVQQKQIQRQQWAAQYLYLSANAERASAQLERRQKLGLAEPVREPAAAVVVEVLLEVVRSAGICPASDHIAARLAARGIVVTVAKIEAIYSRHGLKKTLPSN
jgi:hypothetical protein